MVPSFSSTAVGELIRLIARCGAKCSKMTSALWGSLKATTAAESEEPVVSQRSEPGPSRPPAHRYADGRRPRDRGLLAGSRRGGARRLRGPGFGRLPTRNHYEADARQQCRLGARHQGGRGPGATSTVWVFRAHDGPRPPSADRRLPKPKAVHTHYNRSPEGKAAPTSIPSESAQYRDVSSS